MSKIGTKTIQYSIYDRTDGTAKYIDDTQSYKRPDIEYLSDTFSGAGIMGEIDIPTLGQIGAMEGELAFNRTNAGVINLFTPGSHQIEARWVTNVLDTATGNSQIQANKEIITVLPKTISLGDVQGNETNESSMTYEIIAYQYILDGASKIKIDKLNNVLMVNGKDYSSQIRDAL